MKTRNSKKVEPHNPQSEIIEEGEKIKSTEEDIDYSLQETDNFKVATLPDGFFMLIIAPRRQGKSEKLQSLLEDIRTQGQPFDYVFLFSQTNAGYEGQIPNTFRFSDLSHLPYIVNKQAEVKQFNLKQKQKSKRVKSRVLVILDDMIGEEKGANSLKNNGMIRKLAVNGRHLGNDGVEGNGISTIIVSQAVKAIPKTIRLQTDIIMVARASNRIERETIVEEFATLKSGRDAMKEAYKLFDDITLSKPFRFMVISNHLPSKRSNRDFIHYYDGVFPVKQKRLFGDARDWDTPASNINIFS